MANNQKGQVDVVAQTYATSLFELAEKDGGLDAVESIQEELEDLVTLLGENPDLDAVFRSRIISTDERGESLQKMFGDGNVSDLMLRFLLVLNRKERLGHLADVSNAFRQMYWSRLGRIEVEAITASPMSDLQTEEVKSRIQQVLEREPVIRNVVDASLIGGLKLRIGDRLIDASVASRLRSMQERLRRSGTDRIRGRFRELLEDDVTENSAG